MTLDKLRIIGSALAPAALFALITAVAPEAVAAPCPDVEVVFARGTTEPPGVGGTGGAFVDALRSQLGSRSLGVYAVVYPASNDFDSSTPAGARDAAGRIRATAANCPNTRMVLGGYSQGAAVIDMATGQLPPEVADHVAAVADFGGPRSTFADSLSPGPSPVIAPAYAGKLIDLCVPNDPICFQGGWDMGAHGAYVADGLVNQAAAFAAGRV
ncbi:cutinase family protein [Mycolicibacterium arseniciresistens]|uniref:Cutinase family protein n=1 Tax=Mycolicibacterium arseniciresistens TaxID=3062257 RepID=A0ABT8UES5_9MYCO|nr:cutinase family protein [Mycolicibacterium arseniciresistens]MDO3635295.1 cutinase family protein [Mycolicibacterium arseniciresistens]